VCIPKEEDVVEEEEEEEEEGAGDEGRGTGDGGGSCADNILVCAGRIGKSSGDAARRRTISYVDATSAALSSVAAMAFSYSYR